jgi:multiple antibiotic resistance protein
MSHFLHVFIPLFVAMDIFGLVPIFISLTHGMSEIERRRVAYQAILTALLVSIFFLAVGTWIFKVLGISLADFQVAGGLLLLVFAVTEILNRSPRDEAPNLTAGPVPLGIPLIVGPAVLTSLLVLAPSYGYVFTLTALCLNLLLVALILSFTKIVSHGAGKNSLQAVSQVIHLFLAAIGVSLIRHGLH